jgi:hypothetical protein
MKYFLTFNFLFIFSKLVFSQLDSEFSLVKESRRDLIFTLFVDYNQDGFDDIMGISNNRLYYFPNDGNAHFNEETILLEPGLNLVSFLVEDLNSDGFLDLITAHYEIQTPIAETKIWRNDGSNHFILESILDAAANGRGQNDCLVLEDLNNDGLKDLLATGQSGTKYFKRISNFQFTYINDFIMQTEVEVGDVNNDGWKDIVGAIGGGVRVALNDGNGDFPSTSVYGISAYSDDFTYPQLIDYDSDGDLDLAILFESAKKIILFSNNGDGVFTQGQTIVSSSTQLYNLSKEDINHDGILDLVWKNWTTEIYSEYVGAIRVAIGNGSGFNAFSTIYENFTGIPPVKFSSNLGNGVNNLLLYGGLSGDLEYLTILTESSSGVYDQISTHRNGYFKGFSNMLAFDYNNDGMIDLLNPPIIYKNQGDFNFETVIDSNLTHPLGVNYSSTFSTHADLNNDGFEDLIGIRRTPTANYVGYWLNQGGDFGDFISIANVIGLHSAGAHDINNDGFQDIYFTKLEDNYPEVHYAYNDNGNGFNLSFEWMENWGYNNLPETYYSDYIFAKNNANDDNIKYVFSVYNEIYITTNGNITPQKFGFVGKKLAKSLISIKMAWMMSFMWMI